MRWSLFIIFLAIVPFTRPVNLSAANPESYEEMLKRGIEAFYQTDWNRASEIFKELEQRSSEDPRAFFFNAMIPFWGYFFGGDDAGTADEFLKKSQKAIEISYKRLQEHPHDTTMVLMLSGLYGYRSLVAASEQKYQTAIKSGMTGFKYTRQLLAIDADDPRALIGKGIFYYMMGSVPPELRWATNLMGIKGNSEAGFAILEQAAASDSFVSNDAKMILSYLYRRDDRYQEALHHIKDLCNRYNKNIIFHFTLADLLEKSNRRTEAKKAYRMVVELQNSHLNKLKEQSKERLLQL